MSKADEKEIRSASVKMRVYVTVAVILLFIMAFLSSLGIAFLYILGGLSIFFFFLAWQNWKLTIRDENSGRYNRSERGGSFAETIRSTFRNRGGTVKGPIASSSAGRRVVLIVSSIAGGLFFLVIIMNVFTSGEEESSGSLDSSQDANGLYNSGDYDASYAEYRKNILKNPSDAASYYGIASIKSTRNERDSALYYYERALEADPQLYDAAYGKAIIYFNEQNYAQSNEELKYILNRTDQYVNAFLLAGDNYYSANNYDQAIGYYQNAYRLGARSKELSNIMAYIYDVKGNQSRAIELYKETLQYDSTLVDIYKRLGELIPGEEGRTFREKALQQW